MDQVHGKTGNIVGKDDFPVDGSPSSVQLHPKHSAIGQESLETSHGMRSSQTIFLRIIYAARFVKTVGPEEVIYFAEIRILNFLTNKKGNLREKLVNSRSWQGH